MDDWKFLIFVAALFCFLSIANDVPSVYSQTENDRKTLAELERDVRRDLDKKIAEYRPPSNKKSGALKPVLANTWERPSVKSGYDKFKDVTTNQITAPLYHAVSEPRLPAVGSLRGFIVDVDVIATYSYNGQIPKTPDVVTIIFKTFGEDSFFGG